MHLLDLPLNDMHRILLILIISYYYTIVYNQYMQNTSGWKMLILYVALPFPGKHIAAGFPWADRGCRLGQNTFVSCPLLCVKSKQKWKALNQFWNLYIYIYYVFVILHTLSVVFSGWFPENDQTLGLIEILACGVYSTTSPSPLLYTLYTFQNDPKAVSKKVWRSPQKSQTTWHVTLSIARQEQARPAEGIIEDLGDDVDSARLWPWGQRVNHYFLRPADAISQNTRKKDTKIFRKS